MCAIPSLPWWVNSVFKVTKKMYPFVKERWGRMRARQAEKKAEVRALVDEGRNLVRNFGLHYD